MQSFFTFLIWILNNSLFSRQLLRVFVHAWIYKIVVKCLDINKPQTDKYMSSYHGDVFRDVKEHRWFFYISGCWRVIQLKPVRFLVDELWQNTVSTLATAMGGERCFRVSKVIDDWTTFHPIKKSTHNCNGRVACDIFILSPGFHVSHAKIMFLFNAP